MKETIMIWYFNLKLNSTYDELSHA